MKKGGEMKWKREKKVDCSVRSTTILTYKKFVHARTFGGDFEYMHAHWICVARSLYLVHYSRKTDG